jgi:hypothetical protein
MLLQRTSSDWQSCWTRSRTRVDKPSSSLHAENARYSFLPKRFSKKIRNTNDYSQSDSVDTIKRQALETIAGISVSDLQREIEPFVA